jgi:anti-anti-sigma factor
MQLRASRANGVSVITLSGNLTVNENPGALKDLVLSLALQGARRVVLSVAALGQMDSSCLGEIVASYTTMTSRGGMLKLAHVGPHLARLLETTKLNTVFEVYATVEEAVGSFASGDSRTAGLRSIETT